ncbi:MAG: SPFH domain-containing protein [Fimbriimonadaceae bacterium]|jgi:regulator of protease activity HflC (stomatin/prohibitin superfamily)|nr:SPFH domain-containing protein [Fimbriimonadaceae bacterium]
MNEKNITVMNGGLGLLIGLAMLGGGIWGIIADQILIACLLLVLGSTWLAGLFIVEPNGSKVLLLFGRYVGTVKQAGFHWANPFLTKRNLSLRVRTLNSGTLKVNDLTGNPIEIGMVVVWQVTDTYAASFEVDAYEDYVTLQSETALRHSSSSYPYDAADHVVSLRQNADEVSVAIRDELQSKLGIAGIKVIETKIAHLAYAPEIAGVMLRRQQASAVISARQMIVDGAVGMVEMALQRIESEGVIEMDDERKAAMVSNLMVVLCSESGVHPVVNTGTLYS